MYYVHSELQCMCWNGQNCLFLRLNSEILITLLYLYCIVFNMISIFDNRSCGEAAQLLKVSFFMIRNIYLRRCKEILFLYDVMLYEIRAFYFKIFLNHYYFYISKQYWCHDRFCNEN